MARISWNWADWWNWYRQLETDQERSTALRELEGRGWLKSLSPKVQAEVMMEAPNEILEAMPKLTNLFHSETYTLIAIELIKRKRRNGK